VTVLLQGTFTPFTTRPCWAHPSGAGYGSQGRRT
jgi:hypothetical protein